MIPQISKICFFSFNKGDALSHLRMMAPACQLGLQVIEGFEKGQAFPERVLDADIVVIQRDFPRLIDAYFEIYSLAQKKRVPVIVDLDDLLFELPEDHPDRLKHAYTETVIPIGLATLEADIVTVSTQHLLNRVINFNKNVQVLPNFLDDQIWHLKPPAKTKHDEKLIIGYMGGTTHQPDLQMVEPVIQNLLNSYSNKIEFHTWGIQPPDSICHHPAVVWHDQIVWNYPEFASYFQIQGVDIFIAPLVDNIFNKSKSSIKYLEYSSLGAPGVYSKLQPYSNVITHGETGFLASSYDEWNNYLVQLIENSELRFNLATNAQQDIQSKWLLSKNAHLWLTTYHQAYKIHAEKDNSSFEELTHIRYFVSQAVAWESERARKMAELEQLVKAQAQSIKTGEDTITALTNSKTWKLALYFQHILSRVAPPNSSRSKFIQRWISLFSRPN